MERTVLLVGTLDTKGAEYAYLRERLRLHGVDVILADAGVERAGRRGARHLAPRARRRDGRRPAPLAAGGRPRRGGDGDGRGRRGARPARCTTRARIGGVLAAGGSGGTAIATRAMQALPVGAPKLMVSTMAAGNTADYVGASDVMLMASVTDVAGRQLDLRPHPRQRRGRDGRDGAGAAGRARRAAAADRGSMFGVTTPCVTRAREALESSAATRCSSSTPPAPAAARWRA